MPYLSPQYRNLIEDGSKSLRDMIFIMDCLRPSKIVKLKENSRLGNTPDDYLSAGK